jgi:NADH-quinone oxidoreductase subunit A
VEKYLDILIFAAVAAIFPALNVALGSLLRRNWPEPGKQRAYESGELPFGDARVRFRISYYIFALVYLVFDIESAFLFPWAVVYLHLNRAVGFAEMLAFIVMLLIGWFYAWKKGVLTWT